MIIIPARFLFRSNNNEFIKQIFFDAIRTQINYRTQSMFLLKIPDILLRCISKLGGSEKAILSDLSSVHGHCISKIPQVWD